MGPNETQPELPKEFLPPEPIKGTNTDGLIVFPSNEDSIAHAFRVARAERRRQEKAEKKAKRLAAGKALPSAETLVLIISGEDRRRFRAVLDEASKTPPIPTKRDAALAIFRMGLAALAALAEQQAKRDNLIQPATGMPTQAQLAAARMGGGALVGLR